MNTKQRNIRLDESTDTRLELLAEVTGKTISGIIRDLLMDGEVRVSNRVGDKAIQAALVEFHDDLNENFLHTNAKLARVADMITCLGDRATKNQKIEDLLYSVESNLVEIRQDLAAYRQQADQGASEIVDLQR
jgi:ribbon-helix-helix protein, copG family